MVLFKSKNIFIWTSLLVAFGVALFQTLNNAIGLVAVLALFGVLLVYAAFKDMAMPVLLFFLPWSTLLKLRPGTLRSPVCSSLRATRPCLLSVPPQIVSVVSTGTVPRSPPSPMLSITEL